MNESMKGRGNVPMKDPYKAKDPEKWRVYHREHMRKWRLENREKYLAEKREYYKRNKEKEARRISIYQKRKNLQDSVSVYRRHIRPFKKVVTLYFVMHLLQNPGKVSPPKVIMSEEDRREQLRANWRNCRARRRARIRRARVEQVDLALVWRRDSGVCQICLKKVRRKADVHYDHIVPLSQGGEHSYRNIVVAHAICNMRKHDRAVPQQMRLLGV